MEREETMSATNVSRRHFLRTAGAGAVGASLLSTGSLPARAVKTYPKPAVLGGSPVRSSPFPTWPIADKMEEEILAKVVRSGAWHRGQGKNYKVLEKDFAQLIGTKYCQATNGGTNALHASLLACGIQGGDEVLVSPYTYIATIDAILMVNALPVFIDTDIRTHQLNTKLLEERVNDRTKAILPVHIAGGTANMADVMRVAKKYNLTVIEDACQSHLAESGGRIGGSIGDLGCFSFNMSKNLTCGEGGAVTGNDADLMDRVHAYHTVGKLRFKSLPPHATQYLGLNYRINEFSAAVICVQMTRLKEQTERRVENGNYLNSLFKDVAGVDYQEMHHHNDKHVYFTYQARYHKEQFNNLSQEQIIKALQAEGIPCTTGYRDSLHDQEYLRSTLASPAFKIYYTKERLEKYWKENQCPENEKLCSMGLWFRGPMFLGTKSDMDSIVEAIEKVRAHSETIKARLEA